MTCERKTRVIPVTDMESCDVKERGNGKTKRRSTRLNM